MILMRLYRNFTYQLAIESKYVLPLQQKTELTPRISRAYKSPKALV